MGNKHHREGKSSSKEDEDEYLKNSQSWNEKTKLSMPASLRSSSVPLPVHILKHRRQGTPVLGSNDSLSDVYNAPKNVSARASVVEVGDHQFTAPTSRLPQPPRQLLASIPKKRRRSTIVRSLRCDRTLVNMTPIDHIGIDAQKRMDAEKRLLPPPSSVVRLMNEDADDEQLRETITEACRDWLPDALTNAYLSPRIKSTERQLLGTKLFTTNLGWASCWKLLKSSLKRRMLHLGIQLEKEFWNDPSRDLVRKYSPGLNISNSRNKDFGTSKHTRQDSNRLVPLPVGVSFRTKFEECCYIHYLRLLATAMDSSFQKSVMECLGGVDVLTYRDTVNLKAHKRADPRRKRSLILEHIYHNGIKGYERMYVVWSSRIYFSLILTHSRNDSHHYVKNTDE